MLGEGNPFHKRTVKSDFLLYTLRSRAIPRILPSAAEIASTFRDGIEVKVSGVF